MSFASMKSARGAVLVATLLASAGCANLQKTEPVGQGLADGVPLAARWAADILDDGRIAVAYYDQKRDIKLQLDDQLVYDSATEYKGGSLSGLEVKATGGTAWLAFRPKEPQREIAIRSTGGARMSIDDKTLPLPRVTLFPEQDGGVTAFWTGETGLSKRWGEFGIGVARFDAQGQLLVQDSAQAGELPTVVTTPDGSRVLINNHSYTLGGEVSAWWQAKDGSVRTETIATNVKSVQPTGGWASGSRLVAYWNNESARDRGEFKLEMAYSDGDGKWPRAALDWDVKEYPNEVRMAGSDGRNLLMAVLVTVQPEEGERKEEIRLFHSHDGGASWNKLAELRGEAFDYARQSGFAVKELQDGNFIVLWSDWRYLRPSLRYSILAREDGKALVSDAPFSGMAVAELPTVEADAPVFERDGELIVVAARPEDSFAKQALVKLSRKVAELYQPVMDKIEPDYDRLVERVNAMGRAYVEKRYVDAYTFYDPFYRASVTLKDFLETQGRIVYKEYAYVEAGAKAGVGAKVVTRIVASVPKFVDNTGATFESEEKEMESVARWFWIDGDWYREYFSQALEQRYTRH